MKSILVIVLFLAPSAFAANSEIVHIAGAGGSAYDPDLAVKDIKAACAVANTSAENQAKNACEILNGKVKEVGNKSVNPTENKGGRNGYCRIALDLSCEVVF